MLRNIVIPISYEAIKSIKFKLLETRHIVLKRNLNDVKDFKSTLIG